MMQLIKKHACFIVVLSFVCVATTSQAQLTIQNGGVLYSGGNALITLQDIDLINNGVINQTAGSGRFLFTGFANNNIGGSSTPVFDVIEIAKTGTGKILLQQKINIVTGINFTSGFIDLNSNIILLQPGALLNNEKDISRITGTSSGYIEASAVLNAPVAVNPGNLGAVITSAQNPGSTIVRRGHVSQTNGNGAGNSILRYFDIIPTNNTALNATLRFNYLDAETNGLDENSLVLWKSTDNTHWTNMGFESRNSGSNYVQQTGIADFSRWTLASINSALPVLFSLLNVNCMNGTALVAWKTTQEENSSSFSIQRSEDGITWQNAGSIAAAGNSSIERSYSYTDQAAYSGKSFYRIATVDINGAIQYSKAISLTCGNNDPSINIHPNPVIDLVWISLSLPAETVVKTSIYDGKSGLLYTQANHLSAGSNQYSINMKTFPAGLYLMILQKSDGGFIKTVKIIKR